MSKSHLRYRFDVVEVLLVAAFLGFGIWVYAQMTPRLPAFEDPAIEREIDRLAQAYGPAHYSQFCEEWIVRDFFKDKRDGFFVDVGANHYRAGSTTFYLEEKLGWSGLAIDPQQEFEDDYRRYRRRTRFFPFFVSDTSNRTARLYIDAIGSQTASAYRPWLSGESVRETEAPTITLTDLLDQTGVRRIDFVSIDVELSEPGVLRGLDIDRFRPTLVCIEAHAQVRQQILDYFAGHSYVLVGTYLDVDRLNLYFTPLGPNK